MEALEKLGINGWMLVFQAVNFAILLVVLYRFAYGPMIRFLDDRSEKIQQGLDNAIQAKRSLEEAAQKESQILLEAQKEAKKILEQADIQSKKRAESSFALAEAQSAKLLADAKMQAEQDAKKLLLDAQKDLTSIVLSAVEKVVKQKMDSSADASLITKLIS